MIAMLQLGLCQDIARQVLSHQEYNLDQWLQHIPYQLLQLKLHCMLYEQYEENT
jgi:hypothetical protein